MDLECTPSKRSDCQISGSASPSILEWDKGNINESVISWHVLHVLCDDRVLSPTLYTPLHHVLSAGSRTISLWRLISNYICRQNDSGQLTRLLKSWAIALWLHCALTLHSTYGTWICTTLLESDIRVTATCDLTEMPVDSRLCPQPFISSAWRTRGMLQMWW